MIRNIVIKFLYIYLFIFVYYNIFSKGHLTISKILNKRIMINLQNIYFFHCM